MDVSALAALAAKAAEASPMSNGLVTKVAGRTLAIDGDGLCYYCAGNDDTSAGQARINVKDKIESAMAACGAESFTIYVTASGSTKGDRFTISRAKPYQGQRSGDRRPKNWRYLRECMEAGILGPTLFTSDREADDLFSLHSKPGSDIVIYTQDKDMRMVPGLHLDWVTHVMVQVPFGTWSLVRNDKLYGRAWFWSQMLHGDQADNIPGLPFYTDGSILKSGPDKGKLKKIKVGEKSPAVVELLPKVSSDMGALILLRDLYQTCYGSRWAVELLEQGILLWMRNDEAGSLFNVCAPGNPLHPLTSHEDFPAARAEIEERLKVPIAETEDDGSSDDAVSDADSAGRPVCPVSTPVQPDASGAGSRSLDGSDPIIVAPVVQCPPGQGREQLQAVRRPQPVGIPEWQRRLLAASRN